MAAKRQAGFKKANKVAESVGAAASQVRGTSPAGCVRVGLNFYSYFFCVKFLPADRKKRNTSFFFWLSQQNKKKNNKWKNNKKSKDKRTKYDEQK